MTWEIIFWIWLSGAVLFGVLGTINTLTDSEVDAGKVRILAAIASYLAWPITLLVVIAAEMFSRLTRTK